MLTKTKNIWQKSQNWNFSFIWANFAETLPRSMHNFGGVKLISRGDVVLPYGPMLKKTKKKIVKNQNCKIFEKQK